MILEFSQYLENYLWPNYMSTKATFAHMMSIVIMLNEKFRERVAPWQVFNFILNLYSYQNYNCFYLFNFILGFEKTT